MKKRAIPSVPMEGSPDRRAFDQSVKERLETIQGVRGGKIKPLPATASTAEIVAAVNELIELLQ